MPVAHPMCQLTITLLPATPPTCTHRPLPSWPDASVCGQASRRWAALGTHLQPWDQCAARLQGIRGGQRTRHLDQRCERQPIQGTGQTLLSSVGGSFTVLLDCGMAGTIKLCCWCSGLLAAKHSRVALCITSKLLPDGASLVSRGKLRGRQHMYMCAYTVLVHGLSFMLNGCCCCWCVCFWSPLVHIPHRRCGLVRCCTPHTLAMVQQGG